MATKRKSEVSEKKSSAPSVVPSAIVTSKSAIEQLTMGVTNIAKASSTLTLAQMPQAVEELKAIESALEATREFLTKQLIDDVVKNGAPVPETKSREYNGIRIRPWRTTLEDKKVEALLRSKDISPQKFMATVVSYKVDDEMKLIGPLTKDEVETCRYETKWVLDLKNGKKG